MKRSLVVVDRFAPEARALRARLFGLERGPDLHVILPLVFER